MTFDLTSEPYLAHVFGDSLDSHLCWARMDGALAPAPVLVGAARALLVVVLTVKGPTRCANITG